MHSHGSLQHAPELERARACKSGPTSNPLMLPLQSSSSSSWNKPTIQFSKHSGVSRLLNFFIDPWDFDVKSSQSAKHERRRGLLNSSSNFYHLLLLKYPLRITTNRNQCAKELKCSNSDERSKIFEELVEEFT